MSALGVCYPPKAVSWIAPARSLPTKALCFDLKANDGRFRFPTARAPRLPFRLGEPAPPDDEVQAILRELDGG